MLEAIKWPHFSRANSLGNLQFRDFFSANFYQWKLFEVCLGRLGLLKVDSCKLAVCKPEKMNWKLGWGFISHLVFGTDGGKLDQHCSVLEPRSLVEWNWSQVQDCPEKLLNLFLQVGRPFCLTKQTPLFLGTWALSIEIAIDIFSFGICL